MNEELMRLDDDGSPVPDDDCLSLSCGMCEKCIGPDDAEPATAGELAERLRRFPEATEPTHVPEWDGDYEE